MSHQMVSVILGRVGGVKSDAREKPNDPPDKPAGFVYNNEAVRPAVALRYNVIQLKALLDRLIEWVTTF